MGTSSLQVNAAGCYQMPRAGSSPKLILRLCYFVQGTCQISGSRYVPHSNSTSFFSAPREAPTSSRLGLNPHKKGENCPAGTPKPANFVSVVCVESSQPQPAKPSLPRDRELCSLFARPDEITSFKVNTQQTFESLSVKMSHPGAQM